MAPAMLRVTGRISTGSSTVTGCSHSSGMFGISKPGLVAAAMISDPSLLTSTACARARPIACCVISSLKPVRSRL